MSEQKPSHEVEGIVRRAPRRVQQNVTVASIFKWKKLEPPRLFLELDKLSNRGRRSFDQGVDQEPDGHSDRAPEFLCGDEKTFQKDNHLCSTPPVRPLW
jgi:hypothetical protein